MPEIIAIITMKYMQVRDKENWIKVAQKNTNEIQNQNGETFDLNISARYLKIVGKYNSMIEVTKR